LNAWHVNKSVSVLSSGLIGTTKECVDEGKLEFSNKTLSAGWMETEISNK